MSAQTKQIVFFMILACGFSWSCFGLGVYLTGGIHPLALLAMMAGPTFAALVMVRFVDRTPMKETLAWRFRPFKWWAVAWFLVLMAVLLSILLSVLSGSRLVPWNEGAILNAGDQLTEEAKAIIRASPVPTWLVVLQASTLGIITYSLSALLEELGWRGYLWTRLRPNGFWHASAVIGFFWGIWHAPAILAGWNYPSAPVLGVFVMTLFAMSAAPLFGWLRDQSGSVLPPTIAHGTINATGSVAITILAGGSTFTMGVTGWPGIVALGALGYLAWRFRSKPAQAL